MNTFPCTKLWNIIITKITEQFTQSLNEENKKVQAGNWAGERFAGFLLAYAVWQRAWRIPVPKADRGRHQFWDRHMNPAAECHQLTLAHRKVPIPCPNSNSAFRLNWCQRLVCINAMPWAMPCYTTHSSFSPVPGSASELLANLRLQQDSLGCT